MISQSGHEGRGRLRGLLVLGAVLCLPLLAAQSGTAADSHAGHNGGVPGSVAAAALAQVQHPDGSPRQGYDPTQQRQVRLGEAARQPQGLAAGQRPPSGVGQPSRGAGRHAEAVNHGTHVPARDVQMGKPRVKPEEVLPGDGLLVNGCVAGYGRGGACLPSAPRSAAREAAPVARYPWKCAEVRRVLPGGISVDHHRGHAGHGGTVVDPLTLDSNKDGLACGPGDR